jgi:hypothetical protein
MLEQAIDFLFARSDAVQDPPLPVADSLSAAVEVLNEGAAGTDPFSPIQEARIGLEAVVLALAGAYASCPPEEAESREDRRQRRR